MTTTCIREDWTAAERPAGQSLQERLRKPALVPLHHEGGKSRTV
jgi:hypothetical protein